MVRRRTRLSPSSSCGKPADEAHSRFARARRFALLLAVACCASARAQSQLPDAPDPQLTAAASGESEHFVPASLTADVPTAAAPVGNPAGQETFPPAAPRTEKLRMHGLQSGYLPQPRDCVVRFCSEQPPPRLCCQPNADRFGAYLRQSAIHIYTPLELGRLAMRGIVDPFNLLTIAGTSAVTEATDSHSPYGPGAMGIAKLSGVALTQDMTNAFFETFLIPSIDHQDPHFHRMPNASLTRRIAHCVYQPFWTDSDTGKGMVNYATIVGDIADEAVDVSYVPYQRTGWGPGADRVAVNLATTPLGNFVTEFVPDAARHINLNVVFVQRIIDRVAVEESGGGP